jgi:hypothetical protein
VSVKPACANWTGVLPAGVGGGYVSRELSRSGSVHSSNLRTADPPQAGGVKEDQFQRIELPAGDYWLLASNTPQIDIIVCSP